MLPGTYDVKVTLAGVQGVRAAAGAGDRRLTSAASTPSWRSASSANRSPCSPKTALLKTDKADTGSAFSVEGSRRPSAAGVPELSEPPRPRARLHAVGVPERGDRHARTRAVDHHQRHEPQQQQHPRGRRDEPVHLAAASHAVRRAGGNDRLGQRDDRQLLGRSGAGRRRGRHGHHQVGHEPAPGIGVRLLHGSEPPGPDVFRASATTRRSCRPTTTSTAARSAGRSSRTRCSTSARSRGSIGIPRAKRSTTCRRRRCARGDFSEALNNNGSLQLIYDPRTGDIEGRGRTAVRRQRHSGGSHQRRSPGAINEFYPLPNGPGNSDNYFKEYISTFDRNQYDVKINWNRSPGSSDLGKDRRDGRDGEQPAEAVVRRRRPREDEDVGRRRSARPSRRADRSSSTRPSAIRSSTSGATARTTAPTTAWSWACPARTVRTSGRAACRSGATA